MRIPYQSAGVKRTMVGARQVLTANQQVHPQQLGSFEPHLMCQPLLNQEISYPRSCNVQGVLGTKDCYRTCDFYYNLVFRWFPFPSVACELASSTCTPEVCGPCKPPFEL